MAVQYTHLNISATTNAASTVVDVEEVLLISNDSLSGNLLVSLQDDVAGDYITLLPGESYKNLPVSVNRVYYKSSAGTVTGRFFGLQK